MFHPGEQHAESSDALAQSPTYYTVGEIQPWDFIRDQGLNYHLGNAVKYIARAGKKPGNSAAKDLAKAIHYLENELQFHVQQASQRVSDELWLEEQYRQHSSTD